jgi:hypothetical protein
MNNWPPETRGRLMFVLLLIAGLAALIWFSVIAPLQSQVNTWSNRVGLAGMQLQLARTSVDRAGHYRDLVERNEAEIQALEARMAHGDYYTWVLSELGAFGDQYDIDLYAFLTPQLGDLDLPPQVPYRLGQFTVTGWAHYHSFGAFLAAFENSSPFVKIQSLTLARLGTGGLRVPEPEQLSFRLEFLILARTNGVGTVAGARR